MAVPIPNASQPQSMLRTQGKGAGEAAVDDHEADQRDQPEQGAGGGPGREGVAVREGVGQQDRAGHDGQPPD